MTKVFEISGCIEVPEDVTDEVFFNKFIEFIPLFIKKPFMRNLDKLVNNSTTSTLSNLGIIEIDEVNYNDVKELE